ncbi:hypothetical protein EV401DRAFT_2192055 [Pisolithus croceorrhizus]|nr:hypothetical protein EV401DRAFT_2192055 [Pisolithus croceorrhizus]
MSRGLITPVYQQPTIMFPSSIPNTLDDATHEAMDNLVNKHMPGITGEPNIYNYMFLLQIIVRFANGTMDPKYDSSQATLALLGSQPALLTMLRVAWNSKSYRDIRNLEILQAPNRILTAEEGKLERIESRTDLLHRAFVSPYRGKAVDAFCEYLEQNNKKFDLYEPDGTPQYYGKFCSIVQSSGTGKSRLLLEVRPSSYLPYDLWFTLSSFPRGVLVLYMNLRPPDDDTGFPARDDVPATILMSEPETEAVDYSARCCAFFAAIFMTVSEHLSTNLASGSLEDALQRWNDSICKLGSEDRKQFFLRLKARYEMYRKLIKSDEPVTETSGESCGSPISGEYSTRIICTTHVSRTYVLGGQVEQAMRRDGQPTKQQQQATRRMPGYQYMIHAYRKMTKALGKLFIGRDSHKPKFVIALDEAHEISATSKPESYCLSTILCRAISIYSGADRDANHAVWVVFASTNSRVADFAALRPYYDSARLSSDGRLLYPPYSQLGWDQCADPLEGISATEVARAGHTIGYGRALWKSLQELYDVVQMKLVATTKLSGPPGNEDLPLVTWSQRFCLNITMGHHGTMKFIQSAVASHLRVCVRTTQDRAWSFTTYPSEPFVSCAAASILHRQNNLDIYLEALEDKILSGMVDVGKSGELASRLLWLLAKDLYVRRTPSHRFAIPAADGQEWNSELADCQMISVVDYLRFVFGEDFWDRAGWEAKEAFKDAFVNFSHWVSMDQDISVPKNGDNWSGADEWTLRHWHRTSAVQCCHGQPLVDKMIPIYFKETVRSREDHSRVSQIFISDKARISASKKNLNNITRHHESIDCHSSLPWVAILVDLGLQKSAVEVDFSVRKSSRPTCQYAPDSPCLHIYAAAINQDTFPFLSRSERLPLTLRNIIGHEQIPPNDGQLTQFVQEQVRCGSTSMGCHMNWGAWTKTCSSEDSSSPRVGDNSNARRKRRRAL